MTTQASSKTRQHVVKGIFLLVCLGAIVYVYYQPAIKWLTYHGASGSTGDVCTQKCLTFLNRTQPINNCTSNTLTQTLPPHHEDNTPKQVPDTVILIWVWPFGFHFDVNSCESKFGVKGCQITDDRSQLDKADGVMFHLRDISGDIPYLLNVSRPPHQKWVLMNMESPTNSPRLSGADNLFNLTSSYRRDSDIWVPYGKIVAASKDDKTFKIPAKDKLVCWIVSNWNQNYDRTKYYYEFKQHIKIEVYGRPFGRHIGDKDYLNIMSSCKFYLAFENSIHKDYFSDKLFHPLSLGTVPVVLGPTRDNYEEFIPRSSFIHVEDFKSSKDLAAHLTFLSQNQEAYEAYFNWRKDFSVKAHVFGHEHACRICEHIQINRNFRVFKNFNKWYFG